MDNYLAFCIGFLSVSAQACMDEPVPYIPIVFESGRYIEKPELLTKQHIQKARVQLNRCLSEREFVSIHDEVLYIGKLMAENRNCIASVTSDIEKELFEFKAQFEFKI